MLSDLFKKVRYITVPMAERVRQEAEVDYPPDVYMTCPHCAKQILKEVYESPAAYHVCPACGHHARLTAQERVLATCDPSSFTELFSGLRTLNPLSFEGYHKKIETLQSKTCLQEAVLTGKADIMKQPCLLGIMDSRFMMASMGSVVGEKLARLFETGILEKLPVVLFCASGGARMQEGIFSLMQMAKVSAAVARHSEAGLLYITVLTDPTTGGVTASFAMLGDIILSEPDALIGFAGRRVIEGTIHHKLPDNFQRAEFQREHGFIDRVVPRRDLRVSLGNLLKWHMGGGGHGE